jgi:hypothetical protein
MEHITDYVVALSTLVAVFGMVWKMTSDMRKHCEDRIGGMYKRFDQHKERIEETHVSKEVCTILHNQLVEDIHEIKSDVKQLLRKANGQK